MNIRLSSQPLFCPASGPAEAASRAGFRFGRVGAHTSRTMMLAELETVLSTLPSDSSRDDYAVAIIEANCLRKPTNATRRLTNQRLSELYTLDPHVPVFRILRRLWDLNASSRPLLALLCSLARDPLLAATAAGVIRLPEGAEFQRSLAIATMRTFVGERLNDSTLGKVVRNTASSWSQSGHLEGRTFKVRRLVTATAVSVAFALYLAQTAGFQGDEVLRSGWIATLDCGASSALALALEAKRMGLVDLRVAGDVFELNVERIDPESFARR